MLIRVIYCLLLFFFVAQVYANKIEIINANELTFQKTKTTKLKKLIGDVQFKQNDTYMYCDSAYLDEGKNFITAYSHIKIIYKDSIEITGDTLFFDGQLKLADLRGKVEVITDNVRLTTKFLNYNLKTRQAQYKNYGQVVKTSDSLKIVSKEGRMYNATKTVHFTKEVVLTHPLLRLKTDTLIYELEKPKFRFFSLTQIKTKKDSISSTKGYFDRINKIYKLYRFSSIFSHPYRITSDSCVFDDELKTAKLYHKAVVMDTSANSKIMGDYLFFNQQQDSFFITSDAKMIFYQEKDSSIVTADTIHSLKRFKTIATIKDTAKYILAYPNFRFFNSDIQAKADSFVLSLKDSLATLYKKPVLWSGLGQYSADTVIMIFKKKQLRQVNFIENTFIAEKTDSVQPLYNQIKGKNMTLLFDSLGMNNIMVRKDVSILYYLQNEEGKYQGVNRSEGKRLTLGVKNKKIEKIKVDEPFNAKILSLKNANLSLFFLRGFNWLDSLRPKSWNELLTKY